MIDVAFPLSDIWGTAIGFISIMTFVVGAMGLGSKSLAVSSLAAYVTFLYYAVETEIQLLQTIAYITLTLIIIAMAMKLWRAEGFETGS